MDLAPVQVVLIDLELQGLEGIRITTGLVPTNGSQGVGV